MIELCDAHFNAASGNEYKQKRIPTGIRPKTIRDGEFTHYQLGKKNERVRYSSCGEEIFTCEEEADRGL